MNILAIREMFNTGFFSNSFFKSSFWDITGGIELILDWPLTTSLTPSKATGSPTFTRASGVIFQDHEDLYQYATNDDEAVFKGARRVENLLTDSDDISTGNWSTSATISDNGDGSYRMTTNTANQNIAQNVSPISSSNIRTFVMSVDIKRVSGSGNIFIYAPSFGSTSNITASVTTSWKRFSVSSYGSSSLGRASFALYLSTSGDSIDIRYPQLEEVTGQDITAPSEYVDSETDYGAGVNGVRYFSTENGNTVASNVVTEATGAALTTQKGIQLEPASTNKVTAWSRTGADKLGTELASGSLTIGRVYKITARTEQDFTADGAADNNVGTEFVCTATNVTLDADDKVQEIGGTKISDGTFVSGLGTGAQNTAAATTAIPNMTVSDTDGNSVLSIVDDSAALAAAGLDRICPSGKAYKFDNSAGGGVANVDFSGALSAADHSLSAFVRGDSAADDDVKFRTDNVDGTAQDLTNAYLRYNETITALAADLTRIEVPAGDTIYFVFPQAEAQAVATSPIITEGAAGTRAVTSLTIPTSGNFSQTEGMVFADLTLNWNWDDVGGVTGGIVSVENGFSSVLYYGTNPGPTTGRLLGYDGTNAVNHNNVNWSLNTVIKTGASWGDSQKVAGNGSSTSGSYDGEYDAWPSITIGKDITGTNHFKNIRIYNKDKGTAFLESETT